MQTATCLIKTSPTHTIPRPNITPLEAQVLMHIHKAGAGENPIIEAVQTEDTPGKNEFERVAAKYGRPLVESMYPGVVKKIPETFAEVGIELQAKSNVKSVPSPVDLETDVSPDGSPEVVVPVAVVNNPIGGPAALAPIGSAPPVKTKTPQKKLP